MSHYFDVANRAVGISQCCRPIKRSYYSPQHHRGNSRKQRIVTKRENHVSWLPWQLSTILMTVCLSNHLISPIAVCLFFPSVLIKSFQINTINICEEGILTWMDLSNLTKVLELNQQRHYHVTLYTVDSGEHFPHHYNYECSH